MSTYTNSTTFCNDIESFFSNLKWPYKSISLYDDNGLPDSVGESGGDISLDSVDATVSQLFDNYIPKCLEEHFEDIDIECGHRRQYPDMDLTGDGLPESPVALDIKTALRDSDKPHRLNSVLSVGTHGRYFNNPDQNPAGIKRPYGDYKKHFLLIIIYSINEDYDIDDSSERYVEDISAICDEKWKFATKSSASGGRKYVASPGSIDELINRDGVFSSATEFENYWRDPVGN